MRSPRAKWLTGLTALWLMTATAHAQPAHDAARAGAPAPPQRALLQAPPPLDSAHAHESMAPIVIERPRIKRPTVHQVFERNLHRDDSVRFVTAGVGNGRRCTRVLPFGYEACTDRPTRFVFLVG